MKQLSGKTMALVRNMRTVRTSYDDEAECHLLAMLLTGSKEKQARIFREATPELFDSEGCRLIYELAHKMYCNGETLGLWELYAKHKDVVGKVPLPAGLDGGFLQLGKMALRSDNPSPTLARLRELQEIRELQEVLAVAQNMVQDEVTVTPAEVWQYLGMGLTSQGMRGANREEYSATRFASEGRQWLIDAADTSKQQGYRINVKLHGLQDVTKGLRLGQLVIISAATGTGKSALALNIARDTAYVQQVPTLYLNSEMMSSEIQARWFAMCSRGALKFSKLINGEYSVNGKFDPDKLAELDVISDRTAKSGFSMIDLPSMDVDLVLNELRAAKVSRGIKLAIVDYIGRISTSKRDERDMWRVLMEQAQSLKEAAKSLEIAVVMVAQLNTSGDRLAQSSYMVNEADLWINLTGNLDEKERAENYPCNKALEYRKARSCPTGTRRYVFFDGDCMEFVDDPDRLKAIGSATHNPAPLKGKPVKGKDIPL